MPSKLLSEYSAKKLFYSFLDNPYDIYAIIRSGSIPELDITSKYVVKVDQEIKSRMKKGLVKLDVNKNEISNWIESIDRQYQKFIIEPYIPNITKEYYLLIRSYGVDTQIVWINQGGINVQDINQSSSSIIIKNQSKLSKKQLSKLNIPDNFIYHIKKIYNFYEKYYLTFLEINPLGLVNDNLIVIDILARYDTTSLYLWADEDKKIINSNSIEKIKTIEEISIQKLENTTGSSLKFSLIQPNSRVWFILFGGGASVVYFDKWMTIAKKFPDLQPANYGEISGNPDQEYVYEYTNQLFNLLEKSSIKDKPYYLIIGGGIANFTLVDKTFAGIIKAIDERHQMLLQKNVKIYVRRAGPNDQIGLDSLKRCCDKYNIWHQVNGAEKSMTQILDDIVTMENSDIALPITVYPTHDVEIVYSNKINCNSIYNFNNNTTCIIYGNHSSVIQNMLDYDVEINRDHPSIVAIVDPTRNTVYKLPFFWGKKTILIPVYPNLNDCVKNHPNVNGMVNFASYRAAYQSTVDAIKLDNIKFVSVLAEGIAEEQTKSLIYLAKLYKKTLIGPSTIGAIMPGKIRIGNAGGKLNYLTKIGLHKLGIAGIVTRSGGLLNELCYIVCKLGLGIGSAMAIGGDKYTGTNFADVIMYYQSLPFIKIIILLGELGGDQEIMVSNLVNKGDVTKPIIGLCLGSSADSINEDIQFGHAGAESNHYQETANYKNSYMKKSGIIVPETWEQISEILANMALPKINLIGNENCIISFEEAQQSGLIRKHPTFFTSITKEKDSQINYSNVPITSIQSIGRTIGLLWLKKDLPSFLAIYIEKILMICADHGPCVSGAHNTIVTTRAGKDLISSICSGLLTIGSKFGGAINEAAKNFYYNMLKQISPAQFIKNIKIIPGIGHKHYTIYNPDKRIELLDQYVKANFKETPTLDYAKKIESLTLDKKSNLILNVDGYIAVTLIDGFICANFELDQIKEILDNDILNGFFILSRTIGLIGHHIDQKRLCQDLYRTPDNDICYLE